MNKRIFSVGRIAGKLKTYKNKADNLLVLGSGWNKVVDELVIEKQWNFKQVFGVGAGIKGHKGKLLLARAGKKLVFVMAGRLHTYEGYFSEITGHRHHIR